MAAAVPPIETQCRLEQLRARIDRRRRLEGCRHFALLAVRAVSVLVAALVLTFVVDVSLGPPPAVLIGVLPGLAAALGLIAWRRWPAEPARRSLFDWALLVEREQTAPVDLVAALQFDEPGDGDPASRALRDAVIDEAERNAGQIDPLRGFSWRPLPARASVLAALVAIAGGSAIIVPEHAAAFASRLFLQGGEYPTRTRLVALRVEGERVILANGDKPPRVAIPAGAPVEFEIVAAGTLPESGRLALTASGGEARTLLLSRVTEAERSTSSTGETPLGHYTARLGSLGESLRVQPRLGDSRIPAILLDPIPRPVVAMSWRVDPPDFASGNPPPAPPMGARSIAVLPGASIALVIRAENKPLRDVRVEVSDRTDGTSDGGKTVADVRRYHLRPSNNGRAWRLDPRPGMPLFAIDRARDIQVRVEDMDGLAPREDVRGSIRLRENQPPRSSSSMVVSRVLPTARPTLHFSAEDDFGVARMRARLVRRRRDAASVALVWPLEIETPGALLVSGEVALDLPRLDPRPGDTIEIVVEAQDRRSETEEGVGRAEPLVLEVVDREALRAESRRLDQQIAEQLDALIERELGLGDQP